METQNFVFDEQTADDRAREVMGITEKAVEEGCGYRVRLSRPDGWYRAEVTVYPAQVAS